SRKEPPMNADKRRSNTNFKSQNSNLKSICVHLCLSAVTFLLCMGCQESQKQAQQAVEFGKRLGDIFSGNTPVSAAKKMEDQYFPDERHAGIAKLADRDFGRRAPYIDRYKQIAQYDSDWLVRATAIRALNRAR